MNTALLLVDIQNDYFPQGRMPLVHSIEASKQAGLILQACRRQQRMSIVHVQHISTHPNATFFFPCTYGAELHDSVKPLANEIVIKKHYPNSFKDTQLLAVLQKRKIRHLVVAGMMTHLCIDATVRAAFDFGFSLTVLHDACASRDLEFNGELITANMAQAAFLAAMNHSYAEVLSTQQWLQRLQAQAAVAA